MSSNKIIFPGTNFEVYEMPSTIIKYSSFSTIQSHTVLWTPAAGKRIYLTAIDISPAAAVIINLEKSNNSVFLAIQFVGNILPYDRSFSSPVILSGINISITTAILVNITLYGFEM